MRYLRLFIVCTVFLFPLGSRGQSSLLSAGMWNLTALSGELKAGGLYGGGILNSYGISNEYTTSNYYGGIMIRTSSFIWHPNFLIVDVDGGYYPESRQDLYLVSPNLYNVINTQKLHIGTTFFPKKPVTLNMYLNFDNSYDSRENFTDIRTNSRSYGGTFSVKSRFLPLIVTYNQNNWDSKEIQTNRDFNYKQNNLQARLTKSFGRRDKNDLIYTHTDYQRRDYSLPAIRNIADNMELQNGYFLDSARASRFYSDILGTVQKGNDSFKQLRANENLFYKLPHNLTWANNYGFYYIDRSIENLTQQTFSTALGHQLFESLHSGLMFEYNNSTESSYREVSEKGGLDLNYTKTTFANGRLTLSYNYSKMHQDRTSTDVQLHILNEEYTLSDNSVTIIKRPYVDVNSVLVKDGTGTIVYQQYFDYILVSRNNFVEIQRVPGGQIANNTNVFLFYTATQPGSYQYDIDMNMLTFNYSVFKNLLNFYFRTNHTDFSNVRHADNLLLDYLTDNLYGVSLRLYGANAGVEYEDYQSTVVPYKMWRYFFNWQGNFHQRFVYSINANWRDYKIPTEDQDRIYKDVSGMFSYSFSPKTKLDLNIGYQSQRGRQINLDLFTERAKLTTVFRKLTFAGGFDMYDRVYLDNQRTTYAGAYIEVIKKFKY